MSAIINMSMSSAIENSMKGMMKEYGVGITIELGKLYGFNVEEALKHVEQIQITIDKKRKTPAKTQDGEAAPKKKTVKKAKPATTVEGEVTESDVSSTSETEAAPKKKTVRKAKPALPVTEAPVPVEGEVVTEGSEAVVAPKKKTVRKAKPAAAVPVEGVVVSEGSDAAVAPKKRQPKKAKPVPVEGEVTTEPVAPKKRQPKKAAVEGEAPKKQTKKDKPVTVDSIVSEKVMKESLIESCPFPNMEVETEDELEEEEEEILKKQFYVEEKGERIRKSFYVTSEINGMILASKQSTTNAYDSDDDIGEEVGRIVDGKPVFFEQEMA